MKAYYISAALMICALAACSNKNTQTETTTTAEETTAQEETHAVTYTGTLPAADCDGIKYTLTFTPTDHDNGTYALEQVYLTEPNATTFNESGDYQIIDHDGKQYIRTEKKPASAGSTAGDVAYYVMASDSTIVLTGPDFEMPAPAMVDLYTLTLTK